MNSDTPRRDVALRDTPLPAGPARIGQSTSIEQARAAAEVHARVVVAQQVPRSVTRAGANMREACEQRRLAERAFYRYSRGGQQVTGPTVHLARELARCWGNVDYGLTELDRDDTAGVSQMLAYAWDLETNARSVLTVFVPHLRDKKSGAERLTDVRDIYENNANQGARRLREVILAILPAWFVEEAKDNCMKTLQSDGTGKTMAQQAADLVANFLRLGVTRAQLEAKQGRKADDWTPLDLAALRVVGKSIDRGETTVGEEFTADQVTAADIREQAAAAAPVDQPKPDSDETPAARGRGRRVAGDPTRSETGWPEVAQPPAGQADGVTTGGSDA